MKIALIGFGNIGKGVEELIFKRKSQIKNSFDKEISIKKILIKDIRKKRDVFDKAIVFTDNFNEIIEDEEIEVFVEITASLDESYDYIMKGLEKGKHIVTANKALVSKYLEEILEKARECNRAFLYEASVGGGVHIIKSIMEDLHLNDIKSVTGILNGTCNFILSSMEDKSISYERALKDAQELGFAEPDPSADVDGIDSQRKIRILSSLIFAGKIEEEDISTFGIRNIKVSDIEIFKEKKYKLRLLGEGKKTDQGYFVSLMPHLCSEKSVFYNIGGSMNAISYIGSNIGPVSFIGQGAGRYPTADAILRDLCDILLKTYIPNSLVNTEKINLSNQRQEGEFYLRANKKFKKALKKFGEEIIYQNDDIGVFTKRMYLGEILDVIKGMKRDDFFIGKILED